MDELIDKMKKYAVENKVPIMSEDGISFLQQFIKKNNIKNILEIGTAIGYSAICMAKVKDSLQIVSIERDEIRYQKAIENVKVAKKEEQIHLIYGDAFDIEVKGNFDLIFIDAAKAQNIRFFQKFSPLLNEHGYIITDNMYFHGLVEKEDLANESKNVRKMVQKIQNYHQFLNELKNYRTTIYRIGDGIALSEKLSETSID